VILLTGIFWSTTILQELAFLILLIGLFRVSTIPLDRVIRGVQPFLWLFALTAALHVMTAHGKGEVPLWPGGPEISYEGLNQGLLVGFRLLLALWVASLLTFTTTPHNLGLGMERLFHPLRRLGIPVDDLGLMIALTVRFLPILLEELDRITRAQSSRGWVLNRGGALQRVKNLLPIVVPLLTSVVERAETTVVALQCRGYRPGEMRRSYGVQTLSSGDVVSLLGCISLVAILTLSGMVLRRP
jgi:energy-coupling factor transport system permease protein